jgi:MYXO-CTERM domain-containing protein
MAVAADAAAESRHSLRSFWDDDHRHIVSEVMVVEDDGTLRLENVVGGTIDGISMVQIPLGAAPFVPTRSDGGTRLRWGGSCVFITPDAAGSNDVAGDGERSALQAAMDAWNEALGACSYLRLMMEPPEALEVGLDGKNVVKFREETWCRPMNCKKPPECYSPSATAIATVCFINNIDRPDDGTILDVDIEINSVHYAIAVGCETTCASNGNGTLADLQNTLTHELGHLLGLDHTCWDRLPPGPLDDQGNPAPQCEPRSALADEIVQATMYNFQSEGEVEKRTLEADDVEAVCTNYPSADDPRFCERTDITPEKSCCSVAGGRADPPWTTIGLAVAAAAALGRGRRRRTRC